MLEKQWRRKNTTQEQRADANGYSTARRPRRLRTDSGVCRGQRVSVTLSPKGVLTAALKDPASRCPGRAGNRSGRACTAQGRGRSRPHPAPPLWSQVTVDSSGAPRPDTHCATQNNRPPLLHPGAKVEEQRMWGACAHLLGSSCPGGKPVPRGQSPTADGAGPAATLSHNLVKGFKTQGSIYNLRFYPGKHSI